MQWQWQRASGGLSDALTNGSTQMTCSEKTNRGGGSFFTALWKTLIVMPNVCYSCFYTELLSKSQSMKTIRHKVDGIRNIFYLGTIMEPCLHFWFYFWFYFQKNKASFRRAGGHRGDGRPVQSVRSWFLSRRITHSGSQAQRTQTGHCPHILLGPFVFLRRLLITKVTSGAPGNDEYRHLGIFPNVKINK